MATVDQCGQNPALMISHLAILLNVVLLLSDYLFSGSSDNTIKVWNIKTMELHNTIKGHSDPVCTLACTETFLFSGSLRTIKVSTYRIEIQ